LQELREGCLTAKNPKSTKVRTEGTLIHADKTLIQYGEEKDCMSVINKRF
jgi:hypothetical protein